MAAEKSQIIHKHFRLDAVKLKRARKVLEAKTETETVERALELAIAEHERSRSVAEANQKFLRSGVTIRDVFWDPDRVEGAGSFRFVHLHHRPPGGQRCHSPLAPVGAGVSPVARLAQKYGYERIGQARLTNDALIATSAARTGITVLTTNQRDFVRLAEFCPLQWQARAVQGR